MLIMKGGGDCRRPWKVMEGLDKAWVLSKELFTLLQESVCKKYASQTSLCNMNDLRYQLFEGHVDSRQLPPCQDILICLLQASLWKMCLEQEMDIQAQRDMDG